MNYSRSQDLIAVIKKETTGHLERVLVALCLSRADFLATEINYTFKSTKPDETTVAEILCTASPADIIAIKSSYEQRNFGILVNFVHNESNDP
jgi:Annexin